jgi:putative endonuclease
MGDRTYYVYIMGSKSGTLYTGITNDLVRRVYEHKNKLVPGFTTRYNCSRLLYFEAGDSAEGAITRERQVKGWLRSKKIALIKTVNPKWDDLSSQLGIE